MHKIERLLQTLAPKGVEFKTLEEVFEIKNGYTPSKNNPEFWEKGTIPWFRMEDIRENGRILKDSIQHITPKALKNKKLFPKNSIIISTTATIGEHALLIVDSLANQQFTFLSKKADCDIVLDMKFFFYQCFLLGEWCKKNTNVSGFASVDMTAFKKYKFPIKSLLQTLVPKGVEFRKLGEVCEILDNRRIPIAKNKRNPGIYPYYGANGIQDYIDSYIFDGDFVLVGEDGSVINKDNTPVVNWASGKIWVNNHAHVLQTKNELKLKFLYFYLQTIDVSYCVAGTPPKINQENLKQITIPIPPLEIQQEIVKILDQFSILTTDLLAGIPAEIEARKKQYEYYREKLLTFKPLTPHKEVKKC
ncbi:restriction endonuclease subunit S [Helicobacter pylori]|uniref:restriction endonuclease subunit S n=1 Tax=Helicobacter pylori TaxID=210 RepID=UPI001E5CD2BC|nr:restriction endonuclease subunit S [Helicobacter pylori]